MILPATPLALGVEIAETVCRNIEESTFLDREYGFGVAPLHLRNVLTASIGVARYIPAATPARNYDQQKNELLRRADRAMYEAKSQGKGRVVVDRDDAVVNLVREPRHFVSSRRAFSIARSADRTARRDPVHEKGISPRTSAVASCAIRELVEMTPRHARFFGILRPSKIRPWGGTLG
jgi:hypothetical protein